jgi:hypothetical protein
MWANILKGLGKFAQQAGKAALKAAITAAKNPKTWKAAGKAVGDVAMSYGTQRLLERQDLTPRKKLKELTKMFEAREISKKEYERARKKILEAY